ncbi:MAG: DUF3592 domain-containing protein [Chitinivibrionales bacterium]|nr:DUF3592 domain-containing protein [Chitinivibrionales bacterium]
MARIHTRISIHNRSMHNRNRTHSSAPGFVFFILFALAGLIMFYLISYQMVSEFIASQTWPEVACTIVSSSVKEHSDDDGSTYKAVISYSYTYDNTNYNGDRYNFNSGYSSGRSGKQAIVDAYPPGFNTTCYVNPLNPHKSVLNNDFSPYLLLALFPLPFLAVGFGGLLGKLRPRAPASASPGLLSNTHHSCAKPRSVGISNHQLKTTLSPTAKLVGCVCVALFWNAIVSVFLFTELIPSFSSGKPDYILALFLTPFVLIGLLLIGGIFYFLMARTNPVPVVTIGESLLKPGTTTTVQWHMEGNNQRRVDTISLTLIGQEWTRYRRGTDTRTDTYIFYEKQIFTSQSPAAVSQNSVSLPIPEAVMHSFSSDNNKIEWYIKLHGTMKGWPDILEHFPITVTPYERSMHAKDYHPTRQQQL